MAIALTPLAYSELLESERLLHDVLPDIQKLEECGVECQQMRAAVQEALGKVSALKQRFAPPAAFPGG